MPTTRATIGLTRSGLRRESPPVALSARKHAMSAVDDTTQVKKKKVDDETAEKQTKGKKKGRKKEK
jgi:hypothetical protein